LGDKNDHELLKVMKYLYYLKDFKNLKEENEKTYNLKKIFDSNIETYIKYYNSDEWSEEWHQDFDDDGITENLNIKNNRAILSINKT
jgi:hypothetical protein